MSEVFIGIVGGGHGGTSIMRALYSLPDVRLVGLAEVNPEAPGIALAKAYGVPIFNDFRDLLNAPQLDLIFEVTGKTRVEQALNEHKQSQTIIVDARVARLMMELVKARETMLEKLQSGAKELAVTAREVATTVEQLSAATQVMASGAEDITKQSKMLDVATSRAREHLEETDKILRFIRMVADQTKLLGLNAAIEAARAGEHGRGFTVVAQEVRKLAENSSLSADQIGQILHNIEVSVEEIVEGIRKTDGVIEQQSATTQEVAADTERLSRVAADLSQLANRLASLGEVRSK
jgi:methyl-accepting chemotaxis protein